MTTNGMRSVWKRPVRDFPDLIHLAPPVTHPDDSLKQVVMTFAGNPGARSVFVTDAGDRLLGAIPEHELDLDLMTLVLPEQLWSEVREWNVRELMRATHADKSTARDLMSRVEAVTPDRPLQDAVAMMSRGKNAVVPLVDEQGRLLGYLTLFETLAAFMHPQP
ncbi:MAG TPA: CBS domain-containing protein [Chloroflexota bacterium]|nr:CBS domain-containing protein [Chloroflexota bacterium]